MCTPSCPQAARSSTVFDQACPADPGEPIVDSWQPRTSWDVAVRTRPSATSSAAAWSSSRGDTMLTASTKGAGHQRRPAYRCKSGPHLTRMAEPVDDFVTAIVIERLSRPDARLLVRPERAVDVEALQNQAVALRGRLDELGTLYGAGDIDARQLATASTTIRAQLDQVDATLAASVAGSPLAGFLDADDVAEAWAAASVDRKKAIIRTLMTVTLLKAPRGRRPGGDYFDPNYVQIKPRET
jgi:site-specific DNA recombinase